MSRHNMRLVLPAPLQQSALPDHLKNAELRTVKPEDAEALARLMLDAYAGTIDDEGGTLDDAKAEIARLWAGEYGEFLPDASWLVVKDGRIVSAALVTLYGPARRPLLAFSMTAPDHKRQGLARLTLTAAIQSLTLQGALVLELVVTQGNAPAERLYRQLGFVALAD